MLRRIETLGRDRKTVNIFHVPGHITLDKAINKQDDVNFRALYFVKSHPIKVNK